MTITNYGFMIKMRICPEPGAHSLPPALLLSQHSQRNLHIMSKNNQNIPSILYSGSTSLNIVNALGIISAKAEKNLHGSFIFS
jgi:hypothetical protein